MAFARIGARPKEEDRPMEMRRSFWGLLARSGSGHVLNVCRIDGTSQLMDAILTLVFGLKHLACAQNSTLTVLEHIIIFEAGRHPTREKTIGSRAVQNIRDADQSSRLREIRLAHQNRFAQTILEAKVDTMVLTPEKLKFGSLHKK